jgi:hypothetical protein
MVFSYLSLRKLSKIGQGQPRSILFPNGCLDGGWHLMGRLDGGWHLMDWWVAPFGLAWVQPAWKQVPILLTTRFIVRWPPSNSDCPQCRFDQT